MTNNKFALSFVILAAAACSAGPDAASNAQSTGTATTRTSVPRNSPLEPDIKNVPATTGRANMQGGGSGLSSRGRNDQGAILPQHALLRDGDRV